MVHAWRILLIILVSWCCCSSLDGIDTIGQSRWKKFIQDLISRTRTSLAVVASLSASDTDIVQPLKRFPIMDLLQGPETIGKFSRQC